jgi:hypothetical protein
MKFGFNKHSPIFDGAIPITHDLHALHSKPNMLVFPEKKVILVLLILNFKLSGFHEPEIEFTSNLSKKLS